MDFIGGGPITYTTTAIGGTFLTTIKDEPRIYCFRCPNYFIPNRRGGIYFDRRDKEFFEFSPGLYWCLQCPCYSLSCTCHNVNAAITMACKWCLTIHKICFCSIKPECYSADGAQLMLLFDHFKKIENDEYDMEEQICKERRIIYGNN